VDYVYEQDSHEREEEEKKHAYNNQVVVKLNILEIKRKKGF